MHVRYISLLAFISVTSAAVIRRQGGPQFVTGPCKSDIECETLCCGFKTGKCAGPIVAQTRDGGCGFGDAAPNDGSAARRVLTSVPASTPAPPPQKSATRANVGSGKPPGTQFITGPCANDGECASECCGFKTGKCAGAIVAQERDDGCGFGDPTPNDDAARKLRGQPPVTQAATTAVSTISAQPTSSTSSAAAQASGRPVHNPPMPE